VSCIGTPISWLRLERHALGEASDPAVAEHVAVCAACRACLARIEADAAKDLPPLSAPLTSNAPLRPRVRPARIVAIASGLALAAALVLLVRRPQRGPEPEQDDRIKGDAVAFTLVRDDEARITEAGGAYADGDRFKAVVTCPPGSQARFELVVWDDAGPSRPLGAARTLACGNDVALPGAFRLTGREHVRVCLVWADGESCKELAPVP
jgi:hypothetical protein